MEEAVSEALKSAFCNTAREYQHGMAAFYPTVGSRGINEANQVHTFLISLRTVLAESGDRTVTWLESPFLKVSGECKRDRVDGAAYSPLLKVLCLIEAKRIKQGRGRDGVLNSEKALGQIRQDAERLSDPLRIATFRERLPSVEVVSVTVARIVLADIWLNSEQHMIDAHAQWRAGGAFPADWADGIFEDSGAIYAGGSSEYRLLIAVHPELMRLADCGPQAAG